MHGGEDGGMPRCPKREQSCGKKQGKSAYEQASLTDSPAEGQANLTSQVIGAQKWEWKLSLGSMQEGRGPRGCEAG